MGAPKREITLEVEPDSDPICGRIQQDGVSRTFFGWLELADALRAALRSSGEATAR